MASKNIKIRSKLLKNTVLMGSDKETSNIGYPGYTSLFLILATITVLHTYTCISRCVLCITKHGNRTHLRVLFL